MSTQSEASVPAEFSRALDSIRQATYRTDLRVRSIPAPAKLAPHSVSLAADINPNEHGVDSPHGTGRFILLYDPQEPEEWGGPFRAICFAQAPLETEIGLDPFLAEVTWSWLVDGRPGWHCRATGSRSRRWRHAG